MWSRDSHAKWHTPSLPADGLSRMQMHMQSPEMLPPANAASRGTNRGAGVIKDEDGGGDGGGAEGGGEGGEGGEGGGGGTSPANGQERGGGVTVGSFLFPGMSDGGGKGAESNAGICICVHIHGQYAYAI